MPEFDQLVPLDHGDDLKGSASEKMAAVTNMTMVAMRQHLRRAARLPCTRGEPVVPSKQVDAIREERDEDEDDLSYSA